jgi:hypothetical protein
MLRGKSQWAGKNVRLAWGMRIRTLQVSRFRPAASVAQLAEQLICNQQVAGSTPAASSVRRRRRTVGLRPGPVASRGAGAKTPPGESLEQVDKKTGLKKEIQANDWPATGDNRTHHTQHHAGSYPSGQRGQTVNLMALPSQVRILHSPLFGPCGDDPSGRRLFGGKGSRSSGSRSGGCRPVPGNPRV